MATRTPQSSPNAAATDPARKRLADSTLTPPAFKKLNSMTADAAEGEDLLFVELRHLELSDAELVKRCRQPSVLGVTEKTQERLQNAQKAVDMFYDYILGTKNLYLKRKEDQAAVFSDVEEEKLVEKTHRDIRLRFNYILELSIAERDLMEAQIVARQEKRASGLSPEDFDLDLRAQARVLRCQRVSFNGESMKAGVHEAVEEGMISGTGEGGGAGEGLSVNNEGVGHRQ